MSALWPTVLWYGGLLGIALAALFVLWALALYVVKQATGGFAAAILIAALALATVSTWAVTRATSLDQRNQLVKVHAPLVRMLAGSIDTRSALEDVRAVAQPSQELTAFQSKYEGYEASVERVLQAEWQFHRRGAWDEPALLYKTTWDVIDLQVHHARWEKRAEALVCPATASTPVLPDAMGRLQERLQSQLMLVQVVGDQFDGYDLEGASQPVNNATVIRTLAIVIGSLALLTVVAAALVWRKRPRQGVDVLVAIAAIVLVNLAGWLALGTGADQERLRSDLFASVATVYRETLDLNAGLKTLMPVAREGVLQPRDSAESLITDYAQYMNSVRDLVQLVRIWDRAVLTGTLDTGVVVQQERIRTHDDLLNAVRSGMLAMYRQYVQLDRRVEALQCRSEWFTKTADRAREEALLELP